MAGEAERYAQTMWCLRLSTAVRTALACAIVGGTTVYGPGTIVDHLKFPAFSYVTVALIAFDATLGDSLRGCWHAILATIQVAPLATLGRWWLGDAGLPLSVSTLAVVVVAFLVVMPESVPLTAKRIALGQIVLVCTDAVITSDNTSYVFMHPVHVAASTLFGALAVLLAFLLPFPDLAYYRMQKFCRVYADNAYERMQIYLKAFNVVDPRKRREILVQASPIAGTETKLLQSIRNLEDGMKLERPWSRFSEQGSNNGDRLKIMELPMRGIEYTLHASLVSPFETVDQEKISSFLQDVSSQMQKKMEQCTRFSPFFSTEAPDRPSGESVKESSSLFGSVFVVHKHEWAIFFFSCLDMLLNNNTGNANPTLENRTNGGSTEFSLIQRLRNWILEVTNSGRLKSAFKCALSLGMAVLSGLLLEEKNGCWSGLAIATSFTAGREAILITANSRGQGTAIGSVYGVICCYLFNKEEERLLALLPWLILSSFLRQSRMYGQSGGLTAAVAASLILGRKNYGLPSEFAIARLTAVFIGLFCSSIAEFLLNSNRSATLARRHLSLTLVSVQDCLEAIGSCKCEESQKVFFKFERLQKKQRDFQTFIGELTKFVADADSEPELWYLPFRTCCYQKVIGSLSNVSDMLRFITHNLQILSKIQESFNLGDEFQEHLNRELKLFEETVKCLLKKLEGSSSKASQVSDANPEADFIVLEMGKPENEERICSFIKKDDEAYGYDGEKGTGDEKVLAQRIFTCVGAIGFCVTSLKKELDETEICVKEIVRWENHSSKQENCI